MGADQRDPEICAADMCLLRCCLDGCGDLLSEWIRADIHVAPTEAVLEIAPFIIRCYGISFLLLPLNIFSTYYFQALMKPAASFLVSFARGTLISGI